MKIFWEKGFWSQNLAPRCSKIFLNCFQGFSTIPLFIGDETCRENPKESLGCDLEKDKTETSHWERIYRKILSVDRSVDRQRSKIWPLGLAVDRDPTETRCVSVSRPVSRSMCTPIQVKSCAKMVDRLVDQQSNLALPSVDRLVDRQSKLLCQRSTGRSTDSGSKSEFENILKSILFLIKYILITNTK